MPKFYNWEQTLSCDTDMTFVIGARGCGKKHAIEKIIKQEVSTEECVDWIEHKFIDRNKYRGQ